MTPLPDYVVYGTTARGGFANVLPVDGFDDDYRLSVGEPLADEWPDDAVFQMNPAHPRNVKLADAVSSLGGTGFPVISPALRAVIEAAEPPDMEYLPVKILNHKGRVAADDYVIANSFHVVDCLDYDAMGITWNALDPTQIHVCERLAVDAARLPDAPSVLRPRSLTTRVLVRRDVADAATDAGLTGLYFWELDRVTS